MCAAPVASTRHRPLSARSSPPGSTEAVLGAEQRQTTRLIAAGTCPPHRRLFREQATQPQEAASAFAHARRRAEAGPRLLVLRSPMGEDAVARLLRRDGAWQAPLSVLRRTMLCAGRGRGRPDARHARGRVHRMYAPRCRATHARLRRQRLVGRGSCASARAMPCPVPTVADSRLQGAPRAAGWPWVVVHAGCCRLAVRGRLRWPSWSHHALPTNP